MNGRVRVLPPGTPGVPPAVPYDPVYNHDDACLTDIMAADSPEIMNLVNDAFGGVYCTRPKHPESEVHTCHLRTVHGEPRAVVVWGGE